MSEKESKTEEKKPVVIKTATDLQRLKLEKLMKNPDKPVVIPDPPKQKSLAQAPDFVRNVMGSSAGAGSGEFHVYRHLRRKEYARQRFIQEKSEKEKLDEEYHRKIEENKKLAEEKTAKKRAKRLKKKSKLKHKKARTVNDIKPNMSTESDSSSEAEDEGEREHKSDEGTIAKQSNETKDECDAKNTSLNDDSTDVNSESTERIQHNTAKQRNETYDDRTDVKLESTEHIQHTTAKQRNETYDECVKKNTSPDDDSTISKSESTEDIQHTTKQSNETND